jgi:hypothetical protein
MWVRDRNGVLWDTTNKLNLRMNLLANGGKPEEPAVRVVVVTEPTPEPAPKPKPAPKPRAPRRRTRKAAS